MKFNDEWMRLNGLVGFKPTAILALNTDGVLVQLWEGQRESKWVEIPNYEAFVGGPSDVVKPSMEVKDVQ